MTRIITMQDGLDVEVEIDNTQAQEIADNRVSDYSIDGIEKFMTKLIKPISNTYKEMNKSMSIESAKVSVGIKIGIEGNFILAKSNAGANIQVEFTLKPMEQE